MLLYPDIPIAFVHIPKNGGKSIRAALDRSGHWDLSATARDLAMDEAELHTSFEGGQGYAHPLLGRTKLEHLPLQFWREHFAQTWAAFQTMPSFAVLRDPRDRFFSAILQRLGEYQGQRSLRADDPLVTSEAARVAQWLESRGPFSDIEYIHFTRQSDYVELDGKPCTTALFAIDDTASLGDWLNQTAGVSLEVPHDHARREPKLWSRPIQPVARLVGRLLPGAVKRAIYPLWRGSGAFANAAGRYKEIGLDDDVEKFVTEYYARDFALFAQCQKAASGSKG